MALIISTVNTSIRIGPNFKNLTGKKPFAIDLKADTPTEVPNHIAAYFTSNRPHVYRYANEPAPKKKEGGVLTTTGLPKGEFDPVDFIDENADDIENAVNALTKRDEIYAIAKLFKLGGAHKQKIDRLKERILTDIKAKKGALKNVDDDVE